jgi:hypothetical protein
MTTDVLATPAEDLPEEQLEKLLARIEKLLIRGIETFATAAKDLAKMSPNDLKRCVARFKWMVPADFIYRLALYGRGRIDKHWAQPATLLPASVLKREPLQELLRKHDPQTEVEVWVGRGRVVNKKLAELSRGEVSQVIDENRGDFRTANEQSGYLLAEERATQRQRKTAGEEYLIGDTVVLNKKKKSVLIYAHREGAAPGTKEVGVLVPIDTLRRFLK